MAVEDRGDLAGAAGAAGRSLAELVALLDCDGYLGHGAALLDDVGRNVSLPAAVGRAGSDRRAPMRTGAGRVRDISAPEEESTDRHRATAPITPGVRPDLAEATRTV
ncbi:hypothetical protein GCM10027597_00650 [Saccharopolyspora tripterygii]